MALVTQAETVPEVSVIIASYNASTTIERCLAALTTMATAVPFEVVVVDSSRDGTAELIAARFPEVILLTADTRLYPGGGVVVFDDYVDTKPTWGVRRSVDELLSSGRVRPSLSTAGRHVWTLKT